MLDRRIDLDGPDLLALRWACGEEMGRDGGFPAQAQVAPWARGRGHVRLGLHS
jgi:hypothetical protein